MVFAVPNGIAWLEMFLGLLKAGAVAVPNDPVTEATVALHALGYKPVEVKVAIDALAVFVHKDNPIKGLSMQQVDSIFSSTRKCGGRKAERWGDMGLTGEFKWITAEASYDFGDGYNLRAAFGDSNSAVASVSTHAGQQCSNRSLADFVRYRGKQHIN